MYQNVLGVAGIAVVSQLAEPVLGLNKTTAEFAASIIFFLVLKGYDEYKNRKKIAALKCQHEK